MLGGLDGEGDGDEEVVVALAGIYVPGEALVGMEGGAGEAGLAPELGEGPLPPAHSPGEADGGAASESDCVGILRRLPLMVLRSW
ncbi:MAG: hypothetical protein EXR58_01020 [Chloroflexi bacterium]|nr:hypothetical protein [Chloroflexota bacterium]